MTNAYPEPMPIPAKELADGIAKGKHLVHQLGPIEDYQRRYEAHFLRQGLSTAEARSQAEFWAKLKATETENWRVIDPDLSVDDLIMQHRLEKGTADPSSITAATAASRGAYAAASVGGPPSIKEPPPSRFFPISNGITIDRYALNPASDFYHQLLAGSSFVGSTPEMFGSGPLPPFTASGLDSSMLRWVPWTHRHSAAMNESRGHVLMIVQQGLAGAIDPEDMQSAEGRELWRDYMSRITGWVQAVPLDEQGANIDEQVARLYGPDGSQ
jgi:hypothetical protein